MIENKRYICQFRSKEMAEKDVVCGSVDGLTQQQIRYCQNCACFYLKHEEQETLGAYQSVYAAFETY